MDCGTTTVLEVCELCVLHTRGVWDNHFSMDNGTGWRYVLEGPADFFDYFWV